jgi:murein DD-endopeptidase MepM/ murein hydrolase activator NlpD
VLGRGLLERSLVLALALAVLSPALGSQPAGADSDAAQLAQTRKELGAIQKKLTKSKGEAAAITGQVKALDKQIDALNKQMGLDTRAIHDLESSIRTHDARIAQLAALYQGAHAAADSRARAIYMGGPATSLSSLLSASSMGDFMRKTAVWQVAAQLDAKVIIQSARLRDALTVEKEDLARSQAALTTKKGALDSRGELLNNALDQRMAALGAVQAQIKAEEAEIEQLTKESEDLTRKLQTDPAISHGNESVSASGLVFPVRGSILSGYGPRGRGFHYGVDISGATGTPIRAARDGTVVGVSCGSGYGICSIIDHGSGVSTLYAHMSRQAVSGGHVKQGQVIGYVGCTGSSSPTRVTPNGSRSRCTPGWRSGMPSDSTTR